MRKRNPKDVQLAEAIAPVAHGDYGRFWYLANNKELVEFTMGKQQYEQAMIDCFPHMKYDTAKAYVYALLSLVE